MSKSTGRITVGTTASPLVAEDPHNNKVGILIYADVNNSETLWVGYSSSITADQADDTDGFPIFPGGVFEIEMAKPAELFIRSTTTSQKAWFIML